MSPAATLAGVPLEATSSVGWKFTQGVTPYTRTFEVHKDRAKAILEASKGEVELVISSGRGKTLRVKGLSVLSVAAATHPKRMSVLVTDRRYFWDRKLVVRKFNVRRRSGEMRLVDGDLQRIASLPDVTFAKYSIRNESTPWTAEESVKDVLAEVTENRFSAGKAGSLFAKALDVDGLELQEDGQSALKRVLGYVPGLTVFMDAEGVAQLTLKEGGDEDAVLAKAPPPIVGPPLTQAIDARRMRPSKIEVYFQPEDEIRFDFLEGITATGVVREPRDIRNVLPLPDRKLTIAGKVVVLNTWVEINQALLDAWNNDPDNPLQLNRGGKVHTLRPITFDVIRTIWLSPGGFNDYYQLGTQNPVWGRRWNALMQHYRQTFQISRRWRDRIRSARAERVAIIDPENARRAPAEVFVDHCTAPSAKAIVFNRTDPNLKLATNRYAWPLSDSNRLLVDGAIAETALLLPVDEDQMVFRIKYQLDQIGNTVGIIPSILESRADGATKDIPVADPRAPLANFMLAGGKLSAKHRFTTVLTVAPASPQGLKGLFKIDVSPSDAKKVLPAAIAKRIGECDGPVIQLFVRPGVTTARFAWRDQDAAEIEDAILQGGRRSPARLVDPDYVTRVARSIAAVLYALFADRKQGEHVSDFTPDASPIGRIASVTHTLGRRGVLTTALDMPPNGATVDFMSLLDEGTRRQLFEKVQP